MSQKERKRLDLFAQVREEPLSLVEVAALLPLAAKMLTKHHAMRRRRAR